MESLFDTYPEFGRNFRELDEKSQEEIFALSCYKESSYEEYEDPYPIEPEETERKIRDLLPDLFGEEWEDFQKNYESVDTFIRRFFYGGHIINHLLAWYVDENTDYFCDPERKSSEELRFDVEVFETSNKKEKVANIFIKRIVSTKNLMNYLEEFEDKKERTESAPANICLNLVFSSKENADRLKRLLFHHGYISNEMKEWCFSDDDVFFTVLPARVDPKKASYTSLNQIHTYISDFFDL